VKIDLDEPSVLSSQPDTLILNLDEALQALTKLAPRQAKVVELRYFGGMTEQEAAEALKTSPRTVRRDWQFAKTWLTRELSDSAD
jgi:RNA polymerase sigma factor (TIGR02999 family)